MFYWKLRKQIESNICPDVSKTVKYIKKSQNYYSNKTDVLYSILPEYKIVRKDNSNKWRIGFWDKRIGSTISISFLNIQEVKICWIEIPAEMFTEDIWKDILKIKNKNYDTACELFLYLNKVIEMKKRKNKINEDF